MDATKGQNGQNRAETAESAPTDAPDLVSSNGNSPEMAEHDIKYVPNQAGTDEFVPEYEPDEVSSNGNSPEMAESARTDEQTYTPAPPPTPYKAPPPSVTRYKSVRSSDEGEESTAGSFKTACGEEADAASKASRSAWCLSGWLPEGRARAVPAVHTGLVWLDIDNVADEDAAQAMTDELWAAGNEHLWIVGRSASKKGIRVIAYFGHHSGSDTRRWHKQRWTHLAATVGKQLQLPTSEKSKATGAFIDKAAGCAVNAVTYTVHVDHSHKPKAWQADFSAPGTKAKFPTKRRGKLPNWSEKTWRRMLSCLDAATLGYDDYCNVLRGLTCLLGPEAATTVAREWNAETYDGDARKADRHLTRLIQDYEPGRAGGVTRLTLRYIAEQHGYKHQGRTPRATVDELTVAAIERMLETQELICLSDESWWRQTAHGWKEIAAAKVRQQASDYLHELADGAHVRQIQITEVVKSLESRCLPIGVEPVWYEYGPKMERNATWNLETGALIAGLMTADRIVTCSKKGKYEETEWNANEVFAQYVSPHSIATATDSAPQWESLLTRTLGAKKQEIVHYFEALVGMHLFAETDWELMTILKGPPRSGKTTLLKICAALIPGSRPISGGVAGLGGRFGASKLLGSRFCWFDELHSPNDPDKSNKSPDMKEGLRVLKGAISGAVHEVEVKHKQQQVRVRTLPTFMATTNFDIDFAGGADDIRAWERRVVLFVCDNVLKPSDVIEGYAERIVANEGAAIIKRCLRAYTTVMEWGGFTRFRPEALKAATRQSLLSTQGIYARVADIGFEKAPGAFLANVTINDRAKKVLRMLGADASEYRKASLQRWLKERCESKPGKGRVAGLDNSQSGWTNVRLKTLAPEGDWEDAQLG